jgi:uncharacterized protein CbrC (UPF0167 family)
MPLSPEQEALCERLEKGKARLTPQLFRRAYALVRHESPAEMIQEEMERAPGYA